MKAKQEDKSNPGATKLFEMENQVIIYNLTKKSDNLYSYRNSNNLHYYRISNNIYTLLQK